ncbi:sigma-70 family RNA polymerase sigma factor [Streptomyces sp. NPDC057235]|uniref:sigma-70 family RNA polymerase sigma factor n=1 Tax=Streptomyces sp. NPDC057235 TaxID=3346058 RepID=UPI003644AF72
MSTRQLTELVRAAQSGDPQAQDRLLTHHLPLVYNIVGRAMNGHHDVDDVVQETMLRALAGLGDLRAPDSFRSWLVAIAMNVVRGHWHRQQNSFVAGGLDDARDLPQPGADFVGLTVVRLNLSGQRRETAEATRWLEPDDRALLSLWWLECTGDLTRHEVASALQLSPEHTAVRVQRMKAQLDAARVVVRALTENPLCPDLRYELGGWDGRPSGLWRKRIARHARACAHCAGLSHGLYPAEGLLAGLLLVPPAGLLLAAFRERAGLDLATATAPLGTPAYEPAPYGQMPYGQGSYGQTPYGRTSYEQTPYGQTSYEQVPYGQPEAAGHQAGHQAVHRQPEPTGHGTTPPGGHAHEPAGHSHESAEYAYEPSEPAGHESAGTPGPPSSPAVGARGARATRRRRREQQQRGRRRVAIAASMAVAAVTGGAFTLVNGPDEDDLTALDAPGASTVDLTVPASAPAGGPTAATASVTPTATPSGTPRPSRTVSAKPGATASASAPATTTAAAPKTSRPAADKPTRRPTRAPVTKEPTTPSRPTATKQDSGHSSVEEQVIALVNAERAKEGCGAVTGNPLLAKAAQGHSDDMAARDFFDHTNPDGAGPGERVTATGYGWSTYGENIAMGQRTAEQVMESWMNSPGHRANILNCSFKELGVGLHTGDGGPYWTQVFGAR